MQSLIAKLDLAKYNFAICNIGSDVYEASPTESPTKYSQTSRAVTANLSPTLKPHHDPFSRVRTAQSSQNSSPSTRRRTTGSQITQRAKSSGIIKPLDWTHMQAYTDSRGAVFNIQTGESTERKKQPDIKVLLLNDQTKLKRPGHLEEMAREKFDKKYIHFKRSQQRVYLKQIGRFNSLAEINSRADSIIKPPPSENLKSNEELDKVLSQICVNAKQKAAFLERQSRQVVRLRRKILDGEIVTFNPQYTGKQTKNEPESHIVTRNNFWLPVAGTQSLPVTLESERQPDSSQAVITRHKEPEQPYLKIIKGPKLKPYRIDKMKKSPSLGSKRTYSVYEGIHQSNSALQISNSRKSVKANTHPPVNPSAIGDTQKKQEIEINQVRSKECVHSLEGSMIMRESLSKYAGDFAGDFNAASSQNRMYNINQSRLSDPRILTSDFHLKLQETEESEKSSLVVLSKPRLIPRSFSNIQLPKDKTVVPMRREKSNPRTTGTPIQGWNHGDRIEKELKTK